METLPDEILLRILKFCDQDDLLESQYVSRLWFIWCPQAHTRLALTSQDELRINPRINRLAIEKLTLRRLDSKAAAAALEHFPKVKELTLDQIGCFDYLKPTQASDRLCLTQEVDSLIGLEALTLGSCCDCFKFDLRRLKWLKYSAYYVWGSLSAVSVDISEATNLRKLEVDFPVDISNLLHLESLVLDASAETWESIETYQGRNLKTLSLTFNEKFFNQAHASDAIHLDKLPGSITDLSITAIQFDPFVTGGDLSHLRLRSLKISEWRCHMRSLDLNQVLAAQPFLEDFEIESVPHGFMEKRVDKAILKELRFLKTLRIDSRNVDPNH